MKTVSDLHKILSGDLGTDKSSFIVLCLPNWIMSSTMYWGQITNFFKKIIYIMYLKAVSAVSGFKCCISLMPQCLPLQDLDHRWEFSD